MNIVHLVLLCASICFESLVFASDSSEEMYSSETSSEELLDDEQDVESDFDLLIFTQRWPITACHEWREKSAINICGLPSPKNIWTIHGIWPTKLNTLGPAFCNKSAVFNATELDPIMQQLEQFWTNVEKNKPFDSLWRHEWLKHGTCAAAVLSQLNSENKYFGQGLSWLQQHSMADVLNEGGVTPGNNYTLNDIHKVLTDRIHRNAAIECFHDKETKLQLLNEIRVCFSKDLELTDCDGIRINGVNYSKEDNIISNCNRHQTIEYPSTVPLSRFDKGLEEYQRRKVKESRMMKLLVNIYKLIRLLKWTTI